MENKGKSYSIALALVFVFSILISSVASAAQVTRIGNGSDPAIYGSKVVWTDSGVIHVYDLTSKIDTTVSSSASSYPAIYGNKVVWHDESSGTSRLTVYDIPSGARSYITKDIDSGSIPAIYANRIVWSANSNVYMRDISSSTQVWIASGGEPEIYDAKIVYSYDDGNRPRIYVYDVVIKETITASPYGYLSQPHIYGNKVIWSDFYTRMGHISMYDIATGKTIDVTSDSVNTGDPNSPEAGDDTGFHTDINGEKIGYAKYTDDHLGSAGVYIYSISTGQSTQVANYDVLTTPDVYGSTIVWGTKGNDGGVNDNGIYMSDLSATNTLQPVAEFTANVTSGTAPLVVRFTDTSTEGVPTSWLWDTGDGINSKHAMNATHTFTKAGTYTVSLTVGNAAGNNTVTKPNYIVVTDPKAPIADFSASITSGYAPLSVQFTDLSQYATSSSWDFGDGNTSTDQNPMHIYSVPGTYTVNLTAGNGNGTASKTATINVIRPVAYAYITCSTGVYVIDTVTNNVTSRISVGNNPHGVAVSPDGTKVYVTNTDSDGTVSVIDTSTNTVTATVKVGNSPEGIVVSPDGTKVYVANYFSKSVSVIDTATNTVTATVNVGSSPCGVAVSPDGTKVYVAANRFSDTISVIDTATNNVTATVIVGHDPRGIAVTHDGTKAYVTCLSNIISIIDTASYMVTGTVEVGNSPQGIAVSPNGTRVYVANEDSKSVSVIDTATNTVIAVVNVISEPYGIAVTPDGKNVYVANKGDYLENISYFDHNVSVIDTATNTVKTIVEVGDMPIAFGQFIGEKSVLKPVLPVADFSASVTSGYAPLSVQFTDLSQYSISRNWNFGDGTTSTEQNPVHTYSASGTYTVSLTVNNEKGTSPTPKTATITVTQENSSSSSGGGGAGGSPEPAKNVQVKEISQAFITNGKPVKFDFAKNATCIVYVSFDAKKTFGRTTTIAEQLNGKSSLVSGLPEGEVYKSFNIWVGNGGVATSKNIENPVICFKVEKSWVKDKKIDPASITLNRYVDKKWQQLPVSLSGEDNKFLYFTAKTSEFSSFVITGKVKNVSEETVAEKQLESDNGTINKNNTANKEPQNEQKEIPSTPGFETVCGVAGLLVAFLYKRK